MNKPGGYSMEEWIREIPRGNNVILAQAITLAESTKPEDRNQAEEIIERLLPNTGRSVRIGVTGVPGVGKSTFIEAFGLFLISQGKKVAVLAVDPSSEKTKGSILGDKTRMELLSKNARAFIRPSPTGMALGGVTDRTRETILLCEAAGYDVILVETVGVGQSETAVRNMVDFFLLLMLARAGDELQGIKRGIMEMADGILITKADGDNLPHARQAKANYQQALNILNNSDAGWKPRVLLTSALEKTGLREAWEMISAYLKITQASRLFETQRQLQNKMWFHESMQGYIRQWIMQSEKLNLKMKEMEEKIGRQEMLPSRAARAIVGDFSGLLSES
jgi:LAO/AO transport system kinase